MVTFLRAADTQQRMENHYRTDFLQFVFGAKRIAADCKVSTINYFLFLFSTLELTFEKLCLTLSTGPHRVTGCEDYIYICIYTLRVLLQIAGGEVVWSGADTGRKAQTHDYILNSHAENHNTTDF